MIHLLAIYKGYTSRIRHLYTLLCPAWILESLVLSTGRTYLVGQLYAFHQLTCGHIINMQSKFSSTSIRGRYIYESFSLILYIQRIARDQTVSRRSKLRSCTAFLGEQPNPWNRLQFQDAIIQHRGAKPSRR